MSNHINTSESGAKWNSLGEGEGGISVGTLGSRAILYVKQGDRLFETRIFLGAQRRELSQEQLMQIAHHVQAIASRLFNPDLKTPSPSDQSKVLEASFQNHLVQRVTGCGNPLQECASSAQGIYDALVGNRSHRKNPGTAGESSGAQSALHLDPDEQASPAVARGSAATSQFSISPLEGASSSHSSPVSAALKTGGVAARSLDQRASSAQLPKDPFEVASFANRSTGTGHFPAAQSPLSREALATSRSSESPEALWERFEFPPPLEVATSSDWQPIWPSSSSTSQLAAQPFQPIGDRELSDLFAGSTDRDQSAIMGRELGDLWMEQLFGSPDSQSPTSDQGGALSPAVFDFIRALQSGGNRTSSALSGNRSDFGQAPATGDQSASEVAAAAIGELRSAEKEPHLAGERAESPLAAADWTQSLQGRVSVLSLSGAKGQIAGAAPADQQRGQSSSRADRENSGVADDSSEVDRWNPARDSQTSNFNQGAIGANDEPLAGEKGSGGSEPARSSQSSSRSQIQVGERGFATAEDGSSHISGNSSDTSPNAARDRADEADRRREDPKNTENRPEVARPVRGPLRPASSAIGRGRGADAGASGDWQSPEETGGRGVPLSSSPRPRTQGEGLSSPSNTAGFPGDEIDRSSSDLPTQAGQGAPAVGSRITTSEKPGESAKSSEALQIPSAPADSVAKPPPSAPPPPPPLPIAKKEVAPPAAPKPAAPPPPAPPGAKSAPPPLPPGGKLPAKIATPPPRESDRPSAEESTLTPKQRELEEKKGKELEGVTPDITEKLFKQPEMIALKSFEKIAEEIRRAEGEGILAHSPIAAAEIMGNSTLLNSLYSVGDKIRDARKQNAQEYFQFVQKVANFTNSVKFMTEQVRWKSLIRLKNGLYVKQQLRAADIEKQFFETHRLMTADAVAVPEDIARTLRGASQSASTEDITLELEGSREDQRKTQEENAKILANNAKFAKLLERAQGDFAQEGIERSDRRISPFTRLYLQDLCKDASDILLRQIGIAKAEEKRPIEKNRHALVTELNKRKKADQGVIANLATYFRDREDASNPDNLVVRPVSVQTTRGNLKESLNCQQILGDAKPGQYLADVMQAIVHDQLRTKEKMTPIDYLTYRLADGRVGGLQENVGELLGCRDEDLAALSKDDLCRHIVKLEIEDCRRISANIFDETYLNQQYFKTETAKAPVAQPTGLSEEELARRLADEARAFYIQNEKAQKGEALAASVGSDGVIKLVVQGKEREFHQIEDIIGDLNAQEAALADKPREGSKKSVEISLAENKIKNFILLNTDKTKSPYLLLTEEIKGLKEGMNASKCDAIQNLEALDKLTRLVASLQGKPEIAPAATSSAPGKLRARMELARPEISELEAESLEPPQTSPASSAPSSALPRGSAPPPPPPPPGKGGAKSPATAPPPPPPPPGKGGAKSPATAPPPPPPPPGKGGAKSPAAAPPPPPPPPGKGGAKSPAAAPPPPPPPPKRKPT